MQGHTMKLNIKQHVVVLSKEVTTSVNVGYHQNLSLRLSHPIFTTLRKLYNTTVACSSREILVVQVASSPAYNPACIMLLFVGNINLFLIEGLGKRLGQIS